MKHLELTPRLRAVADLVPQGSVLADVGTDHAYLPVWLLLHDRIPRAIASDVRPDPLARAKQTAQHYGCSDRMTFLLCDGLDSVAPGTADTVAMAGMGGETIISILSRPTWIADPSVRLLLQPMSRQHLLRRWLWRHGYDIKKESIVREGNRLYTIIFARYGDVKPMTLGEEWAGRQYPELDQPLRVAYLNHLLDKLRGAMDGISHKAGADASGHTEELRCALSALEEMKREWEQWQQ